MMENGSVEINKVMECGKVKIMTLMLVSGSVPKLMDMAYIYIHQVINTKECGKWA